MRHLTSSTLVGWAGLLLWLAGCNYSDTGVTPSALQADAGDDAAACGSQLPPELESHSVSLWPPNHKFHEIDVEDCVSARDACGEPLRGSFIWASSDEPIDDIGDGHHAPDIGLRADRQHLCVRSERQGPKDGRVYKLGVRVVDGNGNAREASCSVVVDHDQRGVVAADSGEAYRITFAAGQPGSQLCGDPDEPPPPPPPPPPPGDTPDPDGPGPG